MNHLKFITIFENAVKHVEENYIDRKFIEEKWPTIKESYLEIVKKIDDVATFHKTMNQLFEAEMNLSHVAFIPPAVKEQVASQQETKNAPDFLKITSKILPEYAYIKIPTFTLPLFSMDTLRPILEQSLSSLVIVLDLRLNTGGSLSAAGDLLGIFIGEDRPYAFCRLGKWKDLNPRSVHPYSEEENANHELEIKTMCEDQYQLVHTSKSVNLKIDKIPVIVLIDQRAFSCGEVFPQCMKEYGRAILVGQESAGAVVGARDDFDCGEGYSLLLPFVEIVTKDGYNIEGNRVIPDVRHSFKSSDTNQLSHEEILEILKLTGV